jgi:hypothetical protein
MNLRICICPSQPATSMHGKSHGKRFFFPSAWGDSLVEAIGVERLLDEMIFHFTRTIEMDWMLPGIAATGRRVECPLLRAGVQARFQMPGRLP